MKKKRMIFVLLISIVLIIGVVVFVYCNEYIDLTKEDDARIVFAMEYKSSSVVEFLAVDNRGVYYHEIMKSEDYQGILRTCEQVVSEQSGQKSISVTAEEVEYAYQLLLGVNKNGKTERASRPKYGGHTLESIRWYGIRYKRFAPPEKVLLLRYTYEWDDKWLAGEDAQEIIRWMFKWAIPWERMSDSPANA